jgi:circadian clock protein KaiC
VLTGSARLAQESKERAAELTREQEAEHERRASERKRAQIEGQIAELKAELEFESAGLKKIMAVETARQDTRRKEQSEMARSRKAS